MLRRIDKGFIPREHCFRLFPKNKIPSSEGPHCDTVHDGYLCWPPTRAGADVKQHCPDIALLDTSHFAHRKCGTDGNWTVGNHLKNHTFTIDNTFFGSCLATNNSTNVVLQQFHSDILETGRINSILSITLLAISLVTIIAAFVIYYFILPKFVNTILHVRIQKHLYVSIAMDALCKLSTHIVILVQYQHGVAVHFPLMCEFLATISQYLEIALLAWLALDTHFLQVTSRSGHICTTGYMTYIIIGWGLPVVPTSVWAVAMAVSHKVRCWNGHSKLGIKWIIEVPKLFAVFVAFVFLCICVWRIFGSPRNRSMVDVRKIRFEIVMTWIFYFLVVSSIILTMVSTFAPIGLCYACVYVSTVLISSRGLFLSILYCFVNKDVHEFMQYRQTLVQNKA